PVWVSLRAGLPGRHHAPAARRAAGDPAGAVAAARAAAAVAVAALAPGRFAPARTHLGDGAGVVVLAGFEPAVPAVRAGGRALLAFGLGLRGGGVSGGPAVGPARPRADPFRTDPAGPVLPLQPLPCAGPGAAGGGTDRRGA